LRKRYEKNIITYHLTPTDKPNQCSCLLQLSLSPAKNRQDEWMSRPDVIDRRPQQQYFNDRLLITRQNAPVVYSRPPPRRQPSNWIQPNRAPQYRMSPPGYGYGAYPPAYVGHMYSPAMNRFPYYNRYY